MTTNQESNLFSSDYKRWLKDELAWEDAMSKKSTVVSTARGDIEYARVGEGPAVLALHGGPGGFDQALFAFAHLSRYGFSLIAPSRPGYLRTPLATGKTMEEQADACAALLDTLGVDKAAVIFGSAGGGPGYNFAIRHPDRVKALIAIDAVVSRYLTPANVGPLMEELFLSGPGERIMEMYSHNFPRQTLYTLIKQESMLRKEQVEEQVDAAFRDPKQMAFALRFVRSLSDYPKRKAGVDNDMAQFAQLPDLPVEKIRCPSLIIHGTHDSDVLMYHAVYAWENIPGAERLWVREGSHFCAWLHPEAAMVQERIVQFLQAHT